MGILKMKAERLFEALRDLMFPARCLLCSDAEAAGKSELCDNCPSRWQNLISVKCPRCGKTAVECRCNFRSLDGAKYAGTLFFYDYSEPKLSDGKRLIYSLKRSRDRRVSKFLARETAAMLLKYAVSNGMDLRSAIVTSAPRSAGATCEYGFDHGEELARHTARYIGARYESVFRSKSGTAQKNLSAAERKQNSKDSINVKGSVVSGKLYILIDDVITTGATLGRCAALLRRGGAGDIICASAATTISKKTDSGPSAELKSGDGLWFNK